MTHEHYPDTYIKDILEEVKTIALVGASNKPERASYQVMAFLLDKGYDVWPINPGLAGQTILGQTVYADLSSLPAPADMIDIFRNSDAAAEVVSDTLALDNLPSVIWMQLGVRHNEAAASAEKLGIKVIMDRCPKIEYGRLIG